MTDYTQKEEREKLVRCFIPFDDLGSTHWDGCEQEHWKCALVHLRRACDALDHSLETATRLVNEPIQWAHGQRERIEILERALDGLFDSGVVNHPCGFEVTKGVSRSLHGKKCRQCLAIAAAHSTLKGKP
jgi:hypothetical protein